MSRFFAPNFADEFRRINKKCETKVTASHATTDTLYFFADVIGVVDVFEGDARIQLFADSSMALIGFFLICIKLVSK